MSLNDKKIQVHQPFIGNLALGRVVLSTLAKGQIGEKQELPQTLDIP